MSRPAPTVRADFPYFTRISTRWRDNDIYGHVNNVVYYGFFDTAIAAFLMKEGGFEPERAEIIGYAVENGCRFHKAVAYPDEVHVGLKVVHLGRSSVRYALGIFKNDEDEAAADGHFVHVFVERRSERPAPIPEPLRAAMLRILAE